MITLGCDFSYEWEIVLQAPDEVYRYPDSLSPYLKKQYQNPGVYRWQIIFPENEVQFYIGESKSVAGRLKEYVKPNPNRETATRIHNELNNALLNGATIQFQHLLFNEIKMGDLIIKPDALHSKSIRLFLENWLIIYYQSQRIPLWNL